MSLKYKKTTKADPATIWNYLIGKIGNAYGVAGLMGNLYTESALKSCNLQNSYEKSLGYTDAKYTDAVDDGSYTNFSGDSAGYGLAQWTYKTRKAALLAYCQDKGASIGNLEAQLEFLYKELSESYKTVLSTLKSATSVKEASDIVLTKYENPASQTAAVKTKRASYGQGYYDEYAGTTSAASTASTASEETSSSEIKVETAASKASGYSKGKKLKTTANLRMRTGAGEDKTIIKVLPKGTAVTWYGYYTAVSGVKWYLVKDSTDQTGFMSSKFLS